MSALDSRRRGPPAVSAAASTSPGDGLRVTFCSQTATVGFQPGEGLLRLKARAAETFGLIAAFELHHSGVPVRTDEDVARIASGAGAGAARRSALPELTVVADEEALLDLERAHETAGVVRWALLRDVIARLRQQVADAAQQAAAVAEQLTAERRERSLVVETLRAGLTESLEAVDESSRRSLEAIAQRSETEQTLLRAAIAGFEGRARATEDAIQEGTCAWRTEVGALREDLRSEISSKLQEARQDIGAKMSAEINESSTAWRAAVEKAKRDVQSENTAKVRACEDSLKRMISDQRDEIQRNHDLKLSEHREALLRLLEIELSAERHGQLSLASEQRVALELLEAEMRGEISRIGSEASLEHRTALQDTEVRMRAEIEGRHGRLDKKHRSALQSLEASLREEVAKVEMLSVSGSEDCKKECSALRGLVAQHSSDASRRHDLEHQEHRQTLNDFASRVEDELRGRHGRAELEQLEEIERVRGEAQKAMAGVERLSAGDERLREALRAVNSKLVEHDASAGEALRRLSAKLSAHQALAESEAARLTAFEEQLCRHVSSEVARGESDARQRRAVENLAASLEHGLAAVRQCPPFAASPRTALHASSPPCAAAVATPQTPRGVF